MKNPLEEGLRELVSTGLTAVHGEYLLNHPSLAEQVIDLVEKTAAAQNPDGSYRSDVLARDVASLTITPHTAKTLAKEGFDTVGDFVEFTQSQLLNKVGNKRGAWVIAALESIGIVLPE